MGHARVGRQLLLVTFLLHGVVAFRQWANMPQKKHVVLNVATQYDSSPPWLSVQNMQRKTAANSAGHQGVSYQTQPSWITSVNDRPSGDHSQDFECVTPTQVERDSSLSLSLLDSRPQWLSEHSSRGFAKQSSQKRRQGNFDSQPSWIAAAASNNPRLANAYNAACLIWVGALLDSWQTNTMTAASFALASVSAKLLSSAASAGRLSSATYRRLNGCLAVFGIGQALLFLQSKPATSFAHAVASGAAVTGCAAFGSTFLREAASVCVHAVPSVKSPMANAYFALIVVPAVCALISTPPATALTAWLFVGIGVTLKDGATRNRLDASTFRRLNLVVGLALIALIRHAAIEMPRQAPFLITIAAGSVLLSLGNGLRAILSAKRI